MRHARNRNRPALEPLLAARLALLKVEGPALWSLIAECVARAQIAHDPAPERRSWAVEDVRFALVQSGADGATLARFDTLYADQPPRNSLSV